MDAVAPSDGDLVRAVRAGDPGAFEALYRRHAPPVRRTVAGSLGDPDRIADAVQDTFLKALEGLSTLRDEDKVAPWLKAIARNVATDRLRSRVESDVDDLDGEVIAERSAAADELVEIRELAHLVSGALAQLAPRDAQAVAMAGFLDSNPAEIAEALGVSPGAAKVVLHRARRRLRLALKLELLVRRRGAACAEFRSLADEGELVAAAKHLSRCDDCQRAGSAEIHLYEAGRKPSTPAGATIIVRDQRGERTVAVISRLMVGREVSDVPAPERLLIDDPAVSRHHLEIRLDPATGQVIALDSSTNGTRLNGSRMERSARVPISSGDVLTVGDTTLEVLSTPAENADAVHARTTIRRAVNAQMVMVVGDIIGSTSLAEQAGSGPMGALLEELFGELRALLRTFGGTIGNIAGDAFFAIWEREHDEEAARRALDFVLVARRVVKRFSLPLPGGAAAVELGWAVSVGEGSFSAVAGTITTVVGDATNVAFRLASLAGRRGMGGVLVTELVARELSDELSFGEVQKVAVRGREQPVAVLPLLSIDA